MTQRTRRANVGNVTSQYFYCPILFCTHRVNGARVWDGGISVAERWQKDAPIVSARPVACQPEVAGRPSRSSRPRLVFRVSPAAQFLST